MGNTENIVYVDGRPIEIAGERNLLEVVRKAGIELPTFCYHSELSVYGACRMCVVELENGPIIASCSTPPAPGMRIKTNSQRVQRIRKIVLELLLANHDRECTSCPKSGDCRLQDLADRFGIKRVRFGHRDEKQPLDESGASLVRNPNKCILCGDCVRVCKEIQGIGILDFIGRGSKAAVAPAFNKMLSEVDCVNCGQCAAACPTGAIVVKSEVDQAWDLINDPNKMTVVQVAPAVRVALGEAFGQKPGSIVTGKVVAALRRLGFDKIYDTSIAADLTVMEETTELLTRLENGKDLPILTSCCPAWVKYAEHHEPTLLRHLSTCKSPQQMFGSVVKRYWAKQMGKDPKDVAVISIMPCTAKKFEAKRPELVDDQGRPEVDLVLTTQELAMMIKEHGIVFDDLDVEAFDTPFGFATGAGVIFGVTGGVAEAALRAAYEMVTGKEPENIAFTGVRGLEGIKETSVDLNGTEVRVAVAHGLANASALLQRVKSGEVSYHMIEVMACPGGCIGGAGQPVSHGMDVRSARSKGLYNADKLSQLRKAQDNPIVARLYEKWLGTPNGHEAHEALHTHYQCRRRMSADDIALYRSERQDKVDVAVCVGTCCYLKGSYDILQGLTECAERLGVRDRVNLRATFCMEHCEHSPSVTVNGQMVDTAIASSATEIFDHYVMPQITKGSDQATA